MQFKKLKYSLYILVFFIIFSGCSVTVTETILVPEGFFVMGSVRGNDDENPERNIFLSAYEFDISEVTVAQYADCVNDGVCNYPLEGTDFMWNKTGKEEFPVNGVSWFDARKYCQFVKKRLPTEAEWEKVASWLQDKKYNYATRNAQISCYNANFSRCKNKITKTKQYPKELNATFDMAGNLWEWTQDWYHPKQYQEMLPRDPKGARNGLLKVNRGGSYLSKKNYLSTTFRGANSPVLRAVDIGFRCAKNPHTKQ